MNSCVVDDSWQLNGMRCLILENDYLRVVSILDLGAKISHFIYKLSTRDFMFHNPRVAYRRPTYGTPFNHYDISGWDECIPTGEASEWKGEHLDHGDFWGLPWSYQILKNDSDEISVHQWVTGILEPVKLERWLTLRRGEAKLRLKYRLTNLTAYEYEYLWLIHPELAPTPTCRIELPTKEIMFGGETDRFGQLYSTHDWPMTVDKNGERVDLSQVRPKSPGDASMWYAKLQSGWCAMTDTEKLEGIGFAFPLETFPFAWIWMNYGGYRDYYQVGLGPSTGWPAVLREAAEKAVISKLSPHESIECNVIAVVYIGIKHVNNIDIDGQVS